MQSPNNKPMTLEQQVSNRELSERLRDLGVPQESLFWWYDCVKGKHVHSEGYEHNAVGELSVRIAAAFTVAELGTLLPARLDIQRELSEEIIKYRKQMGEPLTDAAWLGDMKSEDGTWATHYGEDGTSYIEEEASTEADARAKMLIYLLENHLI